MDTKIVTQTTSGTVRFDRSGHRATLRASADLTGLATGRYARSDVMVEFDLELSRDAEFLGYAFTQFAMPVVAGPHAAFDFAPAPNLRSPKCVLPLVVRDGQRCILLAPLTNPHEQIITVESDTGPDAGSGREPGPASAVVRWGWHGDLDEVPAGFTTILGVYEATSVSELLDRWASELLELAGVKRRSRSASPLTSHLSYWTDNGAAYWYRTEPGSTIATAVVDAVDELHRQHVPIGSVELDSWFYRHETPRPITDVGYPEEVPPSGAMEWLPRSDAFEPDSGSDPIAAVASHLKIPLVLHARHVSPASPYVDDTWWVDDLAAQPSDPAFFRRWFDDAQRWGATCIEQDWMLMYWFGIRAMRSVPDRAIAWQRALNDHANATDIDLLWCMATPADLIAAVQFDRVIAVRTSDDYRFTDDPALLWTWFLTVNRLVAPLGLWPFKDCFFSNPHPDRDARPDSDTRPDPGDSISGDVHAELEALLSAMSGGPVGLGDRIGHTDREIVMRTCDDDGRLRQPDVPIGLIDDCLFGSPARGERLAWATASTTIGTETWTYVVTINTATAATTLDDSLELAEIGIAEPRHVHEWRHGRGGACTTLTARLAPRDWALFIVCPPGSADVGDTTKYVTVASTT